MAMIDLVGPGGYAAATLGPGGYAPTIVALGPGGKALTLLAVGPGGKSLAAWARGVPSATSASAVALAVRSLVAEMRCSLWFVPDAGRREVRWTPGSVLD